MNLLYTIFIFPIEKLLSSIFTLLFSLSNNYGISLILLSIIVNTLLIPLYHLADTWRKKEKEHQKLMANDIDSIKRNYTGSERHYLLRAAHKIYHYNPLMSLRVSIGILIQIPFFFAAYQLLSHYSGFTDISFSVLQDLSAPDNLFWGFNVLPIIMTVINIYNGLIYSKKIEIKELFQMWVISLLFLVLLYKSASALVLYWTCNNLYSCVKYHIINKPNIKNIVREVYSIIKKHLTSPILQACIITTWFSAFFLYLIYATHKVRSIPSGATAVSSGTFFLLLTTPLLLLYFFNSPLFFNKLSWNRFSIFRFYKKYFVQLFFVAILVSSIIDIVLVIDLVSHTYLIGTANRLRQLLAFKYLFTTALLFPSFLQNIKKNKSVLYQNIFIQQFPRRGAYYFMQSILIALIFSIIGPILIYTTSPSEVGGTLLDVVKLFTPYFGIILAIMLVPYISIPKARYILSTLSTFLLFIIFVYGFIIDLNLGVVINWQFTNTEILTPSLGVQIFETLLWTSIGFILLYTYKRFYKPINLAFLTMIGFVVIVTSLSIRDYQEIYGKSANTKVQAQHQDYPPPPYMGELLNFSSEKNIMVLVLDQAMGNTFQEITDNNPELKTGFDGFVWYKNTVSTSPATYSSITAMVRGSEYSIDNFNKMNKKRVTDGKKAITYGELVFDSWAYWGNALPDYHVSYLSPPDAISYNKLREKSNVLVGESEDLGKYWRNLPENKTRYASINGNFFNHAYISQLTFFRFLPLYLKQRVYNDNELSFNKKSSKATEIILYFFHTWPIFDLLTNSSRVNSEKPTLKYFWTLATHYPFYFKEDCETIAVKEVWDGTFEPNGFEEGRKQSYCVYNKLTNFFDWMKEQEIYNNTKIIIVSDHGRGDEFDNSKEGNIMKLYVLLLVKDFSQEGELQTSPMLMSNADVPSIIASGISEHTLDIPPDPIKDNRERSIKYNASFKDHWLPSFKNATMFDITHQIEFKSGADIYDRSQWNYIYYEKQEE